MVSKRHFSILMILIIVLVPLLLVGCGDDGDDEDTTTRGEPARASGFYEADTPIQTGALGLEYPGDFWKADSDENGIYLATDEANLRGTTPEEGGAIINVTYMPIEGEAGATPITEILTQYIADNNLSFGDVTDVRLLVPSASAKSNVDTADGFIYAMEYDGGVVFMALYTAPGSEPTYAGVANLIAMEVTFDPAQSE